MTLIDDKGRIFGTVNIIDLLAVCLVLAVVAAGSAFVLTAGDDQPTDQQTATITLEITDVQPYVADAIPEGDIDAEAVAAVEDKTVEPTQVVVEDRDGDLHERDHPRRKTVTLELALNVTETDGEVHFEDEPLQVGRELTLDLDTVTVEGNVTRASTDE